jgi:hypothetical protein
METTLGQADWRKSSYSGGTGNCVEVAGNLPGAVAVRDSQDPAGPALILTPAAWRALTRKVRKGELDLAASPSAPAKSPPRPGLFAFLRKKTNPGAARRLRRRRHQDAQRGTGVRLQTGCSL